MYATTPNNVVFDYVDEKKIHQFRSRYTFTFQYLLNSYVLKCYVGYKLSNAPCKPSTIKLKSNKNFYDLPISHPNPLVKNLTVPTIPS